MSVLDSKLRKQLENVVKDARDVAESGARDALQALTVHEGKRGSHLSEEQAELRNRLRIHGRHLGDELRDNGDQAIDRLVNECAYEHWHRMLFSRFLAANALLVEPLSGMAVSLDDVTELASEENKDPWELAASYATGMLPQIFRIDNPVLALTLPREKRKKLEELLESLPSEIFNASDSLGWVYQFWQANAKNKIDASGSKIEGYQLPAVTQLFTEPYMVSFLLDNSIGAWWATRRLTTEDLRTATSEQELRNKVALPGVPLEYLRFIRTPSGIECDGEANQGDWTTAAGSFDTWPKSLSDLKMLDPCCGSGHFLVAMLKMLIPIRMELEDIFASEAIDRIISENIHGLELDQRCVELAAFAIAFEAWRYPNAGGYRKLPRFNIACSGLSVSLRQDAWTSAFKNQPDLEAAMAELHEQFVNATNLGSLIGSESVIEGSGLFRVDWEETSKLLTKVSESLTVEEDVELGVIAAGTAKVASILQKKYHLVATNPPYLSRGKQGEVISRFAERNFKRAKNDLANVFLERSLEFLEPGGLVQFVMPQNWLFLPSYKEHRSHLLSRFEWTLLARLGMAAFEIMDWWAFNVILITIKRQAPPKAGAISAMDVSETKKPYEKSTFLKTLEVLQLDQASQHSNPQSVVILDGLGVGDSLSKNAAPLAGLDTGDNMQFKRKFYEAPALLKGWVFQLNSVDASVPYSGRQHVVLWENGQGRLVKCPGARMSNVSRWGSKGIYVTRMNKLPATVCAGESWDRNGALLVPHNQADLLPLWSFCSSSEFYFEVRKLNQKVSVAESTFGNVSFNLSHWQQVAVDRYPHGLPSPYSDDSTQWLFHGHPASSTDALQVAVIRLLGYRWPAELDSDMELATDARAWGDRCEQLNILADDDGIVCIPAVASEQPADERMLNLLHQAFEDGLVQERVFSERIEVADKTDPLTLDLLRREWKPTLPNDFNTWFNRLLDADGHKGKSLETWLRDKFFESHCKCFDQTPFVWHIWDGHREGFSALVNYHTLAGSNGRRLLEKLTHSYLGDWISRQQDEVKRGVEGADGRLLAARSLKTQLELILAGEPPYDIFVRWKTLHEQPIGWEPDINDGVRLNIRPFMAVDIPGGKKGAGILRIKPNTIKWTKDRGKEVEKPIEDFPWFWDWDGKTQDFAGGDTFTGDRWNDLHYTNAFKQKAREAAKNREVQS
jgi:hypothetical protein